MKKCFTCLQCGFFDNDLGCGCPSEDKWYACPIENVKPENQKALEEYAKQIAEREQNE